MKFRPLAINLSLIFGMTEVLNAQNPFQNLDFEQANVPPGQMPGFIDRSQGLPFWHAFIGTNEESRIYYNALALDTSGIILVGTDGIGTKPIEGNFSIVLQANVDPKDG